MAIFAAANSSTGTGMPPRVVASLAMKLEQALLEVWTQALVHDAKEIHLGNETFPVRRTPKQRLRQVDFHFDGQDLRGLEQNPATKSRWAQMARSGQKVMQFLGAGGYIANVAEGKLHWYGSRPSKKS
ncbi:MAG TPA: hypothetical protein VMU53_04740 [Candidatus Sulfotelmatobacter sp.]|nr:hypothetical protein [Candidatus Sulfotelmatobacter sp.]